MEALYLIMAVLGGSGLGALGATLVARKRQASTSVAGPRVGPPPDVRPRAVRTSESMASPSEATRISRGRYAPKRRPKGANLKESS